MKKNRQTREGKKKWQILRRAILSSVGLFFLGWSLAIALQLQAAASAPVGAFFELGGSIRREIYLTEIAKENPNIPILISAGSPDPCIWLIFAREQAPKEQVWLENCARNTFGNFYYSVPILHNWGVKKVKLITSETHLPRALWMARIHFGARGIWVEADLVTEEGIPGNNESIIKTTLDVTRSFFWAIISPFIQPECSQVKKLENVNIQAWRERGFKCEHQGNIN
ncbi:MAG: YdcF family protein [Oscillatoria sp. PMC 1051.18]|nr:YdcF family protein [Oscillatoria sp. PMC 1050.18]MEC5030828.1 YdcF family protein [Oscillatoria sp. PMC 1051.18]